MSNASAVVCLLAFSVSILACERTAPGHGPKSRVNSPRCVSDLECSDEQHCIKEEHRPDGICGK